MSDATGGRRPRKAGWFGGRALMMRFSGKYTGRPTTPKVPLYDSTASRIRPPPSYPASPPLSEFYVGAKVPPTLPESNPPPVPTSHSLPNKPQDTDRLRSVQNTESDTLGEFGMDKILKLSELKAKIKTGISSDEPSSRDVSQTTSFSKSEPEAAAFNDRASKALVNTETLSTSPATTMQRKHPYPSPYSKSPIVQDAIRDTGSRALFKAVDTPPSTLVSTSTHAGVDQGFWRSQEQDKVSGVRPVKPVPNVIVRGEAASVPPPVKSHRVFQREDGATTKVTPTSEADFDSPLPFDQIIRMKNKAKAKELTAAVEAKAKSTSVIVPAKVPKAAAVPRAIRPPEAKSVASYADTSSVQNADTKTVANRADSSVSASEVAVTNTKVAASPSQGLVAAPTSAISYEAASGSKSSEGLGSGSVKTIYTTPKYSSTKTPAPLPKGNVGNAPVVAYDTDASLPGKRLVSAKASTIKPVDFNDFESKQRFPPPSEPISVMAKSSSRVSVDGSTATAKKLYPKETPHVSTSPSKVQVINAQNAVDNAKLKEGTRHAVVTAPSKQQEAISTYVKDLSENTVTAPSDSKRQHIDKSTISTPAESSIPANIFIPSHNDSVSFAKSTSSTKSSLARNPVWAKALTSFVDSSASLNWLKRPLELSSHSEGETAERLDDLIRICEDISNSSFNELEQNLFYEGDDALKGLPKEDTLTSVPEVLYWDTNFGFELQKLQEDASQNGIITALDSYCNSNESSLIDLYNKHEQVIGNKLFTD